MCRHVLLASSNLEHRKTLSLVILAFFNNRCRHRKYLIVTYYVSVDSIVEQRFFVPAECESSK